MTQKPNPYECCGQVRDSRFCPSCGCQLGDPPAAPASFKKQGGTAVFSLSSLTPNGLTECSVDLEWHIERDGAWFYLDGFNDEGEIGKERHELLVYLSLNEEGDLSLKLFRRFLGEASVMHSRRDLIAEHQLWPVEPAAPPPPKDKAT